MLNFVNYSTLFLKYEAENISLYFCFVIEIQNIKTVLDQRNSDEIDKVWSTTFDNCDVDLVMDEMKDLNCITVKPQQYITILRDVKRIFAAVIDKYPETAFKLSSAAQIGFSLLF